jgi:hypothetical protein
MLGFFFNFINFLAFLSGVAFGGFICFAVAIHYLSDHAQKKKDFSLSFSEEQEEGRNRSDSPTNLSLALQESASSSSSLEAATTVSKGKYYEQKLSKSEFQHISSIISLLDEFNSPLKNMGTLIDRINHNKERELASLENKMKTIVEYSTIAKLEKDFQDQLLQLKDFSKSLKLITTFLIDISKGYSNFSRDLSKSSHVARNNMNKGSQSINAKEGKNTKSVSLSLSLSLCLSLSLSLSLSLPLYFSFRYDSE